MKEVKANKRNKRTREKFFALLYLIAAVFLLFVFYFDIQISNFFASIRFSLLNDFFIGITFVSAEVLLFFILTSLFLWTENKRRWILPLWFTLFLSAVISFILKVTVQRPRPYELGVSAFQKAVEGSFSSWNYSFPSFQTLMVFASLPILCKEFPRMKYFWLAFASLVGISRVYFGVHFLSDVICGALIGLLLGSVILKKEKENKFWNRMYEKIFRK